jgi:hypothetical protein
MFVQSERFRSRTRQNRKKFGLDQMVEVKKIFQTLLQNFGKEFNKS